MRKDKILRRSVWVTIGALIMWFIVSETTILDAWTLDGASTTLGPVHAWCTSPASDAMSATGGYMNFSVCNSVGNWWTFGEILLLTWVITAAVAVVRAIILGHRAGDARYQPQHHHQPPVQFVQPAQYHAAPTAQQPVYDPFQGAHPQPSFQPYPPGTQQYAPQNHQAYPQAWDQRRG